MRHALCLVLAALLSSCFCEEFDKTNSTPIIEDRQAVESRVAIGSARAIKEPGTVTSYKHMLYVVERYAGIHLIDNSNPASPLKRGFLAVPGNYHVAVAGDILVADNSADVLTFDLADPAAPRLRERAPRMLQGLPAPHLISWGYDSIVKSGNVTSYYGQTIRDDEMVTGYRDTTIHYGCGKDE